MKVTDEMLYQNAAAARDIWLGTMPLDNEISDHEFSQSFERKMKKVIKGQRRPAWIKSSLLFLKRTAAVAMVALVITAAGVMSVDAYRERVIEVVVQVFHDLTSYRFYTERSDGYKTAPKVDFSYIPDGFELTESRVGETRAYYLFENREGTFFELDEVVIQPGGDYGMILDTEDSQMEHFYIGDVEAIANSKGSDGNVLWSIENIRFDLYGNIGIEELKEIARGIVMEEPDEEANEAADS